MTAKPLISSALGYSEEALGMRFEIVISEVRRAIEKIEYHPMNAAVLVATSVAASFTDKSLDVLGSEVDMKVVEKIIQEVETTTGNKNPFAYNDHRSTSLGSRGKRIQSMLANLAGWLIPREGVNQKNIELRAYLQDHREAFLGSLNLIRHTSPHSHALWKFFRKHQSEELSESDLKEIEQKMDAFFHLLAERCCVLDRAGENGNDAKVLADLINQKRREITANLAA